MKRLCLVNAKIVIPSGVVDNGYIIIVGTKIAKIGRLDEFEKYEEDIIIDIIGHTILAGFIDQHVHGGGNADTMDDTWKAFEKIATVHAAHGTTSMCLTTVAHSKDKLLKICQDVKNYSQKMKPNKHAKILGVHLEGPFMNPAMKGAHQEEYMVRLNYAEFLDYIAVGEDYLRIITFAPEMLESIDEIRKISHTKTVLSLGHTKVDYAGASLAFEYGVKCVTHFFNAMTLFHHRNPGIIGASLKNPLVKIEIIPDPNLVHPVSIEMAYQLFGAERIIIITDALRVAGHNTTKKFVLAGRNLVVNKDSCYLEDGTIWGSKLTMNEAVRNFIQITNCTLVEASIMASRNSAILLGMENKGSVEIGKDADLVVLDERFNVLMTVVEGVVVYSALHSYMDEKCTN